MTQKPATSVSAHLRHDEHYDRAEEFIEIVSRLSDSCEDDSLVMDRESGVFADPEKVHELNHHGTYFDVQGPADRPASTAAYARDARRAASLGFSGKWAIHPAQIDIANEVYTLTEEEIARARRNIAAYQEAEARGLGAISVKGQLVDAAHVKLAEAVLSQANEIERRNKKVQG